MSPDSAAPLGARERRRRARHKILWRIINPPGRRLAAIPPWWVLLETRGRRSGRPRTTPLARGPVDDDAVWVNSVHGRHADWVRNVEADHEVRIRLTGRWHRARATIHDYDEATVRRFNRYARTGPSTLGIDPVLVRIELQH
jgi:deazaflavin-dependent oxidoreductase (nitroreductase family)